MEIIKDNWHGHVVLKEDESKFTDALSFILSFIFLFFRQKCWQGMFLFLFL